MAHEICPVCGETNERKSHFDCLKKKVVSHVNSIFDEYFKAAEGYKKVSFYDDFNDEKCDTQRCPICPMNIRKGIKLIEHCVDSHQDDIITCSLCLAPFNRKAIEVFMQHDRTHHVNTESEVSNFAYSLRFKNFNFI